jgi:hypothetical protein
MVSSIADVDLPNNDVFIYLLKTFMEYEFSIEFWCKCKYYMSALGVLDGICKRQKIWVM